MGDNRASAIVKEMQIWTQLGGSNLGIYGDENHSYGFHRAASEVPPSDYSRANDPAGPNSPVNWGWACAGDFGHRGVPALRAVFQTILARLMRDDADLRMICEFIGQPWADRPVYYWARWDGVATLARYTGSGHDTWTHLSWWRSKADQVPTNLFNAPTPTWPPYPGYLLVYSPGKVDTNLAVWQRRMLERTWTINTDGMFSALTLSVVKAFQREKGLEVDGIIGPITWSAAWALPVTQLEAKTEAGSAVEAS
jgi:peptidoglycan hydrolase-like protein with peptidoglycan-binding domain